LLRDPAPSSTAPISTGSTFPSCARACVLDRETGYYYNDRSTTRESCCPDSKPEDISHFHIWNCVWQSCDPDQAQKTVEIFMRKCATKGLALSPDFTVSVLSAVAGDHFPVQYQYKDFGVLTVLASMLYNLVSLMLTPFLTVTPTEITPISGLYGGGTLLA